MPIIREYSLNGAEILLWHLCETSDELQGIMVLTEEEANYLQKLNVEKRRAEWLCWHLMVRYYFDCEKVEISYDSSGRPILSDELNRQISVTHGGNLVGIIISEKNCGIDIESVNRNFSRVKNRYLSENEIQILSPLSGLADVAAIGWCAKECAFKIAKKDGIDFIKDFVITHSDYIDSTIYIDSSFGVKIKINVDIIDNHIICYSTR